MGVFGDGTEGSPAVSKTVDEARLLGGAKCRATTAATAVVPTGANFVGFGKVRPHMGAKYRDTTPGTAVVPTGAKSVGAWRWANRGELSKCPKLHVGEVSRQTRPCSVQWSGFSTMGHEPALRLLERFRKWIEQVEKEGSPSFE